MRVNGTLVASSPGGLTVAVDQAFGNCPQYIQQRIIVPAEAAPPGTGAASTAPPSAALTPGHLRIIRSADTFFLGTTHPQRGRDASHRGGPPGFVRAGQDELWWPDYPGNNMFSSMGNLAVDPAASLLFIEFGTGRALQLSGTATAEWADPGAPGDDGWTGRRVRFTPAAVCQPAGALAIRSTAVVPYPRNPHLTS
jgi:uncharacterized protein